MRAMALSISKEVLGITVFMVLQVLKVSSNNLHGVNIFSRRKLNCSLRPRSGSGCCLPSV